jgi:hypothetical protein
MPSQAIAWIQNVTKDFFGEWEEKRKMMQMFDIKLSREETKRCFRIDKRIHEQETKDLV